jgi:Tol biopolymer transport system component
MRRATLIALGAGAVAAALPAAAQARWNDAQLVSVDNARLEQADGGTGALDVSGDGRWVVFQTRATNFFADGDADADGTIRQGGIFRFDRTTGVIALVADGDQLNELDGAMLRRGAARPSVSDDGRWVVFSTAQRLVPQDDNDNVDVYVRDMAVPLTADRAGGGAYQLVSARDGGAEPAQYEPLDNPELAGRKPGAEVTAGQAISADGRYVAFRTTDLASDLPARAAIDTPPYTVFVRDLRTQRTVLASPLADDGSAGAGGGFGPVVLSRDGSTVSWVGRNAARQTRFLPGENSDDAQNYYLWRRWDDADATTRRITGLADPDDPACVGGVESNPIATGPCYGPLADTDAGFNDIGQRLPALSADGWTVAFLSGAGPRPLQDSEANLDVFITSMRPGVTRKAGTRVVTRATAAPNPAVNGEISSLAIDDDGSRLLLVTTRRQFLPPAPSLVGEPRSASGGAELYTVDLGAGGATRRVLLPGGVDLDGAVADNPVLSADGRTIAFVSGATNLVAGDANQQPDAFVVTEAADQQTAPPPTGLGADPIDETIDGDGGGVQLGVRAVSRRDGSVLLRIAAPAAGRLAAVANVTRRAARRRAARTRKVASANARARRSGTVQVTLKLARRDLRSVRRGTPLRARVTVTFTPSGGGRRRAVSTTTRFRVVTSRSTAKSR